MDDHSSRSTEDDIINLTNTISSLSLQSPATTSLSISNTVRNSNLGSSIPSTTNTITTAESNLSLPTIATSFVSTSRICNICRDNRESYDNLLIQCTGYCQLYTHQRCYGILWSPIITDKHSHPNEITDGRWVCYVCYYLPYNPSLLKGNFNTSLHQQLESSTADNSSVTFPSCWLCRQSIIGFMKPLSETELIQKYKQDYNKEYALLLLSKSKNKQQQPISCLFKTDQQPQSSSLLMIHILCALACSNIHFENGTRLDQIEIDPTLPINGKFTSGNRRTMFSCMFCEQSTGFLFFCHERSCHNCYHPICGANNNVRIELCSCRIDPDNKDYINPYTKTYCINHQNYIIPSGRDDELHEDIVFSIFNDTGVCNYQLWKKTSKFYEQQEKELIRLIHQYQNKENIVKKKSTGNTSSSSLSTNTKFLNEIKNFNFSFLYPSTRTKVLRNILNIPEKANPPIVSKELNNNKLRGESILGHLRYLLYEHEYGMRNLIKLLQLPTIIKTNSPSSSSSSVCIPEPSVLSNVIFQHLETEYDTIGTFDGKYNYRKSMVHDKFVDGNETETNNHSTPGKIGSKRKTKVSPAKDNTTTTSTPSKDYTSQNMGSEGEILPISSSTKKKNSKMDEKIYDDGLGSSYLYERNEEIHRFIAPYLITSPIDIEEWWKKIEETIPLDIVEKDNESITASSLSVSNETVLDSTTITRTLSNSSSNSASIIRTRQQMQLEQEVSIHGEVVEGIINTEQSSAPVSTRLQWEMKIEPIVHSNTEETVSETDFPFIMPAPATLLHATIESKPKPKSSNRRSILSNSDTIPLKIEIENVLGIERYSKEDDICNIAIDIAKEIYKKNNDNHTRLTVPTNHSIDSMNEEDTDDDDEINDEMIDNSSHSSSIYSTMYNKLFDYSTQFQGSIETINYNTTTINNGNNYDIENNNELYNLLYSSYKTLYYVQQSRLRYQTQLYQSMYKHIYNTIMHLRQDIEGLMYYRLYCLLFGSCHQCSLPWKRICKHRTENFVTLFNHAQKYYQCIKQKSKEKEVSSTVINYPSLPETIYAEGSMEYIHYFLGSKEEYTANIGNISLPIESNLSKSPYELCETWFDWLSQWFGYMLDNISSKNEDSKLDGSYFTTVGLYIFPVHMANIIIDNIYVIIHSQPESNFKNNKIRSKAELHNFKMYLMSLISET